MTAITSSTFFAGDPYREQRPVIVSKADSLLIPWRKHQKTRSSGSLNIAYGRRHSLESLSGGSLRQTSVNSRCVRWKPQYPLIEKLSGVAHFHYDFVELGPIKVELLPFEQDCAPTNRRSFYPHHQPSILPVLREHWISVDDSSRLSPKGKECIHELSESPSPSSCPSTESNRRADVDVFQQPTFDYVTSTGSGPTKIFYTLRIYSNKQTWTIQRTYGDFVDFDKQLHRCVYDRRFSLLNELPTLSDTAFTTPSSSSPSSPSFKAANFGEHISPTDNAIWTILSRYMERFSDLAGSLITCFPVLKWLELDNRGNHLVAAEETQINVPAVAAAYAVQNYIAAASDELTLKVGDIVSVIDMPPASESVWWRGKLTILKAQYADVNSRRMEKHQHNNSKLEAQTLPSGTHVMIQVGFFPSHCVQLFGNRVRGPLPGAIRDNAAIFSRPVFRRRGKWATWLRFFLANRPSRGALKEVGILKERVFGCDLAEHLESTGLDVPVVLRSCAAVIESNGVIDGIYRGSGVVSNIQRLRIEFDENHVPNMLMEDVHCVASLLKMYFRELPNPLLTYQLYGAFMNAVQGSDSSMKMLRLHDVVQQLPPPHFRTAEFLIKHLARVGEHSHKTGMHFPNLALVWSPNLLRCKEVENAKESTETVLRNVNMQAIVVEYLIRYADIIFSRKLPAFSVTTDGAVKRRARPMSLACNSFSAPSPSKLMNIEEAKRKLMECRNEKIPANVGLPDLSNRKCIDVNGGTSAIPPKYHTVIQLPGSKSFGKIMKSGSCSSANLSGWRSLFSGRRATHDDEDTSAKTTSELDSVTEPSSPQISSPKLIGHLGLPRNNVEGNEPDGNGRKQLRHVRSAENFNIMSNGSDRFTSLDSSIRQAIARRSHRIPKSRCQDEFPIRTKITPRFWTNGISSPSNVGSTFMYPVTPLSSAQERLSTKEDTRVSLKSCRTTDIDRALSVVVTPTNETSTVFPLRYDDSLKETLPQNGLSYFEATILPPPLSPVSEPPLSMDQPCDSDEWMRISEFNLAAFDDSIYEDIPKPVDSNECKSSSAPNSLKEEQKISDQNLTSIILVNDETSSTDANDGVSGSNHSVLVSVPTASSMYEQPDQLRKWHSLSRHFQVSERDMDRMVEIPKIREKVNSTANPKSSSPKTVSQNEEKLLLDELSKSPPDNSPTQDDLLNLLPELNSMYNSLDGTPTTISTLEIDGQEEVKQSKRAPSIADLEVIETNPEWRSPTDGLATPQIYEEIKAKGSIVDTRGNTYRQPTSTIESENDSAPLEQLRSDGNGTQPSAPRFISFKEANALSDRLETWRSVKASRYDSEDDDPSWLASVYDNVIGSATRTFPLDDSRQKKPTPKPRISKLKSSNGDSLISKSDIAMVPSQKRHGNLREHYSATVRIPVNAYQRPSVLMVSSQEQQQTRSSESELANSPLFRKQQQQLSSSGMDKERIKSEPPTAEFLNFGYDQVNDAMESNTIKSESHLVRSLSAAEASKNHHRIIEPSPRSAFSPVLPKGNVLISDDPIDHVSNKIRSVKIMDEPSQCNNLSGEQLQPILLKTSVKRSPSFKSRTVHWV